MNKTKLEQWICETEGLPELTRENLEALQLEKLNRLLIRAREMKAHYEKLPERLESLEQLRNLPFTTADMLGENPGKYLLTSQSEIARIISGATSGTTGPAKRVFYTAGDTEHTVGFFAAGISEMVDPGEKVYIGMPFSGPFGLGDLIARAVEKLGAIPIRAGIGRTWGRQQEILLEEKPENFIGFPVPLLGLARFCGKDFTIRKALVSGDACPEGVMEELDRLLKGQTFPHYGSREMGLGGAVTCPAHEGMHLRENHVLAEIVDEAGNPLPDGQWGELVITTIGLEAMPLIRYRTGDRARFLEKRCPCGGVTKRLDRVSRLNPGGIDMEQLDSRLFRVPELIDYKANCCKGMLAIEAVTLQGAAPDALQKLLGGQAKLTLRDCTEQDLPLYPGKRYVALT